MKFPYQWIARRARKIEKYYFGISRRDAVETAWADWTMRTPMYAAHLGCDF